MTVTAVADSAAVCDPDTETMPPANRTWSAVFDVEAGFRKRVTVGLWNNGKLAVRLRQVRIRLFGAVRHIRWKRFGGREAVGFGTFKSLVPCAGGCTDNGTRLIAKLTRPAFCPGETRRGEKEDAVFYNRVAFVLRERLGVLKPGREWVSAEQIPICAGTGKPPVRIR